MISGVDEGTWPRRDGVAGFSASVSGDEAHPGVFGQGGDQAGVYGGNGDDVGRSC